MDFLWIGLAFMALYMSAIWIASVRLNNFGIVDPAWSFGFGLLAAYFAWTVPDMSMRHWLLAAAFILWSARLGGYLTVRAIQHHPVEDKRYAKIRAEYGANYLFRFFVFFQLQGVSVALLALPFAWMLQNPSTTLNGFEIAGLILWLVALLGESLADRQLSQFKAAPENRGKTMQSGLWRYSRHPNYFFECCVWIAFFIMALGTPGGWISLYCPLIMIYLIVFVTGVPPAEEQSLLSRGEEFKKYQHRTSVLIPWFPRTGGSV